MSHPSFGKRDRTKINRVIGASGLCSLLLLGQSAPLLANPTGGAVVAGGATIGAAGKTLTINQSSNLAIINWQSFSIASGETTKFIVPNSLSATLNRVVGGNPSAIYGTLQSNGQLFLINPSGILVGAGGRIDTAGFLGSTLDVTNDQFLKNGNLTFAGNSTASIDNQGTISGSNGDVYLIANQVSNEGSITAPKGNVGLAAGSDVLYQQAGDQHLFVQANAPGTTRAVGVTNSGTIQAASAELRAAGGNAYALAINNSGSIAATGYKKINGQVYLTSDTGVISNSGKILATGKAKGGTVQLLSQTGTITNSGAIDASATGSHGKGGSILLKSAGGTVASTGAMNAKGGNGGAGGQIEISGAAVSPEGTVDTTAVNGTTGMFTLDPATFTVAPSGGDETGAAVATSLSSSNVTLNANNTVTINDGITWTSANTLTLSTNTTGSTITINSPISGVNGSLIVSTASATDAITTGANGSIAVRNFLLQNGSWSQISANLPAFSATHNFELDNQSTFLRVTGGDGSTNTPYQIVDVYGLQGIGSPSHSLLPFSFTLENNIDASATATWENGLGFLPIGFYDGNSSDTSSFQGAFTGNHFTISGLTENVNQDGAGLFGDTGDSSTITNLNLTNVNITNAGPYTAGLSGLQNAIVVGCTVSGSVSGTSYVGGVAGITANTTLTSSSSGTVSGTGDFIGGLAGYAQDVGNSATFTDSFSSATVNGGETVGGLVGINAISINGCYSIGAVNASTSSDVGGLVGQNSATIVNSFSLSAVSGQNAVGGFVGSNSGPISICYSAGSVSGSGTAVGGFIGSNSGSIGDSYFSTDGSGRSLGLGSSTGIITYSGNTATAMTGLTLAQMKVSSNFDSAWSFGNVWTTNGNTTTPQLLATGTFTPPNGGGMNNTGTDTISGTVFSDNGGLTIAPGVTLSVISGGSVVDTITASNSGTFTFTIGAADVTSGLLITDATHNGDTYFESGSSASTFSGIDIWGSTLRVVADTASNAALKTAIGSLTGHGINYAVSGANLTTNAGINFGILSGYTFDGNVTSSGTFVTGSGALLTGTTTAALQGTTVTLQGGLNSTGSLTVHSTSGQILLNGLGSSQTPAVVHGLTLNSTQAVLLDNCFITLSGGNFTATGTGYTSTTAQAGEANGVNLFNSSILAQGGNITLTGTAGYANPGTGIDGGLGVAIGNDGSTAVEIGTTGSGNITITGTFNQNISSNAYFSAVDIYSDASAVNVLTVQNGNISISGTVSQGKGIGTATNAASIGGVTLGSTSTLAASGTGAISITGTTTGATSQVSGSNYSFISGVEIGGTIETNGGNLTLHGNSGTINTSNSTLASGGNPDFTVGVIVDQSGNISTGSGPTVSITGTAGSLVTTGAYTGLSEGVILDVGTALDFGANNTVGITGTAGAVNAGNGANTGDAQSNGVHLHGLFTIGSGGSLTVTGTGGALTANTSTPGTGEDIPATEGVLVNGDASIEAAGTTTVTITGTAGNVTSGSNTSVAAAGIHIGGAGTNAPTIGTASGLLKITGTAGTSPSLGVGVLIYGFNGGSATISSSTGNVQITGTGGAGYTGTGVITGNYVPNDGIVIADNALVGGANLTLSGKGGANSSGVVVTDLTSDPTVETSPTPPTLGAGGTFTVTSTSGNVTLDAAVSATSSVITSPGTFTLGGSGATFTSDAFTSTAAGATNINGALVGGGNVTIVSSNANVTFGTGGSISDSGAGNNVVIAAGTNVATGHAIINNSNAGAGAITLSNGAQFQLYSASLTGDQLNGITAANTETTASYPASSIPAGNTEFFYSGTVNVGNDTLSGTAYLDGGTTIAAGDTVTLIFNGTVIGTATADSSGDFTLSVSSTDVGSGVLLTDAGTKGNTFFQSGSSATTFTGIDIWGSTLRVVADLASNSALKTVIGSLTGHGIDYAVSGANLSTTSGVNMDIVSNYALDGNITAAGSFTADSTSDLTGSTNATLKGSSVDLSGTVDLTGSLAVNSTAGGIDINGVGNANAPATVHGLTLTAVGGPVILDTSDINLGGGSLTASGTGAGTQLDGVDLFGTTIDAQGGNIKLTGQTGYNSSTQDAGVGISIDNTSLTTSGTGNITLNGNGSVTTAGTATINTFLEGVEMANSSMTTESGPISITGTVSHGTSSLGSVGVGINQSSLDATGTGGSIAVTSTAGNVQIDSSLSADSTTITSPGTLSLANSGGGDAISTGALSVNAAGAITLDGPIVTDGAATIASTGGDITFGTNGTVSDTGTGHNLVIAAGNSLAHSHYIINNSSAGANAISVSNGAQFFLFSADPTNDAFNGIAVPTNNVVFSATFPANNLPTGNGEFFFVANANATGPNPVGSGNTGGGGGGTTGGGGSTPPPDPTSVASSEDNSGSNIVPPAVVTQNDQLQPPTAVLTSYDSTVTTPQPFSFIGDGSATQIGAPTGGLADASGNGSIVSAGDQSESDSNGVGNVTNPVAAGQLSVALGSAVHNVLNEALAAVGDSYNSPAQSDDQTSTGGGKDETILTEGQVAEIGSTVKSIPLSHAPDKLKQAMGDGILKGMPGH